MCYSFHCCCREFVNRTVGVVFGGTCQEVIDSERAELIHETLPDFGCTVEQTKSLTVCTQTFVESPVVAKNFPAQAEPISILITKQQLDSLDLFCAAYKVYKFHKFCLTLHNNCHLGLRSMCTTGHLD